MAAWIVAGVLAGVVVGALIGGLIVWKVGYAESEHDVLDVVERLKELNQPQPGDQEMLDRVLDRLLGAVVPEPREESAAASPTRPTSDAEYEAPEEPVGDWTDPFIGMERPMVARLEPGQAIPGLAPEDGQVDAVEAWRESGTAAFDEWARDTMVPDGARDEGAVGGWVEPLDLDADRPFDAP